MFNKCEVSLIRHGIPSVNGGQSKLFLQSKLRKK